MAEFAKYLANLHPWISWFAYFLRSPERKSTPPSSRRHSFIISILAFRLDRRIHCRVSSCQRDVPRLVASRHVARTLLRRQTADYHVGIRAAETFRVKPVPHRSKKLHVHYTEEWIRPLSDRLTWLTVKGIRTFHMFTYLLKTRPNSTWLSRLLKLAPVGQSQRSQLCELGQPTCHS